VDVETTIIGAGPYGLSVAAHLRSAGLPYLMLGSPMESWRDYMPEGMKLKSERFASNLWDPERRYTLRRYSEAHKIPYQPVGNPLPLDVFCNYAAWFQQNAVGEVRNVRVKRLRRIAGGFSLELADGSTLTSRRVVMASGHMAFSFVPAEFAGLPEPLLMHSTRIGDVRHYAGRDVCIIGAGQSALETAAILHENGARVRLLVRRDRLSWNEPARRRSWLSQLLRPDAGVGAGWQSYAVSELPRVFRWMFAPERRHRHVARSYGPAGSAWLRERVNDRVDVRLSTRVLAASALNGSAVQLRVQGPEAIEDFTTQHVIAATGFKIDVDRIEYLEPALAQSIAREVDGIPALDASFGSSVPGLSIVGVASAPVFGPIMRFMYGAKHVAPLVTARLRAAA
jgi:FAD-dependent urate hydroxylase